MAASGSDRDSGNNAIHHKTLAESKFNSGDLTSALNHARKALALFPDTEGVSSMVTASDGDTPEWYKILKVEPFSHIDTIKEQYRKLALVLRPDENPYAGCEEGFRLVNEAFEVLSDKVRRSEYDMKLRIRVQGEIGACDGETSTFSNGACSSKIITYTRRRKRVGEGNESLRRVSEGGETREEEAKALDRHERLDEEDEGMMTLAEMQSVLKRKKPKVKITERSSTIVSREEHDISSGDETLMEMSTNKEKEALKNKSNKKKKKTNRKELSEVVDLEYVSGVNRKRDRGKLNQENYMALADEDCELYDFDKDRMPRSFKKGQVWAVYDGGDDEKMPRSYCLVSEVVSLNPFKVWITWLDFESEKLISWVKISSFHLASPLKYLSGRFRVSEKALVEQAKPFSHVVNCERVAREVYQIYPRKGSVWAVYSEINSGLQRRKTRRYEIVVCLTMYSDAYGLSVAYLEKVNEESSNLFKRRDYGCNAVRWVEKDDVAALLSHQIPAKKLPEDQAGAGSRESWVLDLASVPPGLVAAT
ncbi:uncharacterized protein LOC125601573 [Brassica napus]|uniref:uncharacterized protein LOC125601573 n=1 Tax=Brassica napus TaxID=3708 RepID=UPI00207891F7|nr:uncharacterized protein LOC125601573 [Brassica napus]